MAPRKQILIVEDNELNREILKEILSSGPYTVVEAENGQEALERLGQCWEDISLILLDIRMPVMDGYDFLDRIKADSSLSSIPVIVTTQSDGESDEVSALAHGATDFVPKPYQPQVILHRVASLINLRETAAMANQFQYDRLTGLYSKEFFFRRVQEELRQNPEREYTIVCSNVENFKLFKDVFGVPAGDRLLKEIADVMRKVVGEEGICGRFDADRFVCLKEREREREDRRSFFLEGESRRLPGVNNVVMKWGIYEIHDRSVPVEQMCDRAFLAAESVKGQYNRPFAVYDDRLRGRLLRERAITDTMASALEEGQFSVYFQPKYSLNGDRLAGAEALVRWNHPELGFISPGEFIPLFEKNGFIARLDRYVWDRTCALIREWKDKGYAVCPVSVNVSRADMYQTDLPDVLREMLQKYDISPAELHLEVTESAYTQDPDQIISTVDRLRGLGFIIEMDDFGSGYSSLNMLSQMKLDILKLDMKFVQNEMAKPADQGILRFIMELARWRNLSVVAEGVESREQVDRLREIGCDYVQGYFFARPMPSAEFERLLQGLPKAKEEPLQKMRPQEEKQYLLVADEDAGYRKDICRIFEGQYQVLEAADAPGALSVIRNAGGTVAVMILSMSLPGDGASWLLRELRRDPVLWRLPILATVPWGAGLGEAMIGMEPDDFLCKHHPLSDLRRRVKHMMSLAFYQERERLLREEAYRDPLTGLLNRRGLQSALSGLRREDRPLAVCLFDLDDLKPVNDRYGHRAGDRILSAFAELLRSCAREGDLLCRYGGDEFVVILKHAGSGEDAEKMAAGICGAFQDCLLPDGLHGTCSAGVTLCEDDEVFTEKLLDRADEALYRAKRKGKGGCCLWEKPEKGERLP